MGAQAVVKHRVGASQRTGNLAARLLGSASRGRRGRQYRSKRLDAASDQIGPATRG